MFQTRQQLVDFLESSLIPGVPDAVIQDGQLEFLGGFGPIPAGNYPGFIIRLTKAKRQWNIVVSILPKHSYKLWLIDDIPWRLWQGDVNAGILYQGDRPKFYKKIKERTINNVPV